MKNLNKQGAGIYCYSHNINDFDNGVKISDLPYVYVLATEDFKFIKIGTTKSIKQRIRNIQSGCPFPLNFWTCIRTPKAKEVEKYLHSAYSKYRTNGEWFCLPDNKLDELLKFTINTNKHVREVKENV
jgi:hypothetical protein